ncbi:MAG: hypothetical protein AB7U83_12365 [Vicinamibacterales bacterium]
MADLDARIDALYQGPLDAFTDARNALAKAEKRPDLKTLAKPSLPAWAVNQVYWHRRAAFDRLIAAAEAVRRAHGETLAGRPADVAGADQAHREAVKATLVEARDALVAAGHPTTPATLDAVRDTLQMLPAPEANGRLVKPLAPTGLAALAGFAVAERPALRVVPPAGQPASTRDEAVEAEAARVRARREAERDARERRKTAEKAAADAKAVLLRAEIALDDAARVLQKRQAERDAAADAHQRAAAALEQLDRPSG